VTTSDRVALVLAAVAVLSMPAFAVVSRGRARDAEVARRGRTILIGFWLRDWLMWAIGPVERALVRAVVSPLVFNVAGVAFGIAAGVAYARGALPVAGWLVLLGGLCDVMDGRIARALGLASMRGAFLDSTLDRFAETFAYVGLAIFFAGSPWGVVATLAALGGSLLVSYTRARGEAHGVQCGGGLMQRAERLVLLALASLLDPVAAGWAGWPMGTLLTWAVTAIGIGATATAVYRTATIAGELRLKGTERR
jgi:CDP-diacylglycerol--glycerol-3-phosphate 3-phosphatidyltransferase